MKCVHTRSSGSGARRGADAGLQQLRHVPRQHPHRLQAFGIFVRFARHPSVYAVPILRRHDGHIRNRKILVQAVERRTRPATAADSHGCGRLVGQIAAARIKHAVEQRAKRTVRPGIIDRRADHKAVGLGKLLRTAVYTASEKTQCPSSAHFPQAIQPCMALVPMWTISAPMPSASSVRATSDKAIKCSLPVGGCRL